MSCGAIADRVKLLWAIESTYGETAPTPYTELRNTGESFAQETDVTQSAEIRADRQIAGQIRTVVRASGDANYELSYGTYDEWFRAIFQDSAWSTPVVVDSAVTDISVDDTDNSFNSVGGWAIAPVVGDWITVGAFSINAANNGQFKVISVTANKVIVEGASLITEAAGDAITITTLSAITNGVQQDSFTIERGYTDTANEFVLYKGMTFGSWNITVEPGSILTGAFSLLGRSETSTAVTVDGAPTLPNTNPIMNAIDNIPSVKEGGSPLVITSFTCEINNGLREKAVVGQLGAECIASDKFTVTGTLRLFFQSKALADKYLNFLTSSLSVQIVDSLGNQYILDVPSVKYTAGPRAAGGTGSDIELDLTWVSFIDAEEGITARLSRLSV